MNLVGVAYQSRWCLCHPEAVDAQPPGQVCHGWRRPDIGLQHVEWITTDRLRSPVA